MRGLSMALLFAVLMGAVFVVVVALIVDTLSLFAPFDSMRSFLLTSALALTAGALGLCASSYGQKISLSSSVRTASPFAIPFALFAGGSATALSLAIAAATEQL